MLVSLMKLMRYDMIASWRGASAMLTPLLFFIMVVCLFPFAIIPDAPLLQAIAPGIIWIAALLANLLSLDKLFLIDAHHGHLDVLLLSPLPLSWIVLSKLFCHWCLYGLPFLIISPILGFLLNLPSREIGVLVLTLLLGTPVLVLLGGIGAALTVGIRHHGLLLPILIMPLYIPVLIFGANILIAANLGFLAYGNIAMMGALLLVNIAIAPLLTSTALKIGII